ncbi:MFS transporter [Catellatospora sichuanensis]|uniref:MFS transporter n=1 Tax=Catellatospora sichuanensis TaxID=1969805 RepID=UPI0011826B33|nr:MFS transporter [Catellatospora sichuanensis]
MSVEPSTVTVPESPSVRRESATASSAFLSVLRSAQVPRILGASVLGRLPLGSAPLALLLAAHESMSLGWAGVVVGAYTAGSAVGQPLVARLADRGRQGPPLWVAAAVSTIAFAVLALLPAPPVAAASAAFAGLGAPPFGACMRALWRDVVGERLVPTAYTLDVTAQELIFIVGPLLTMAAVALGGPPAGLLATAAVQLAGTALYTTAPAVRRLRSVSAARHWSGPLRSGRLLQILAATVLIGFGIGATTVAVAEYAAAAGRPSWGGWLLAAQAVGALAGGLAFSRLVSANPAGRLAGVVVLLAASYLPLALTLSLPLTGLALVVTGLWLPPALTGIFLVVDRVAPPGTAVEAFAWIATAFAVGSGAGAAVAGTVVQGWGATAGFLLAPPAILCGAGLLALLTRWGRLR